MYIAKKYVWSLALLLFICYLTCPYHHLTLKEIPLLQVPEEPKKIVPEKKFPVIKKPEPAPPKGTYMKRKKCSCHFVCRLQFSLFPSCVLYCSMCLLLSVCFGVEKTCTINVGILHLALFY